MIIAWGIFIVSVIYTLVWLEEILNPSYEYSNKTVQLTSAFWFIIALCSAQYIWG